MKKAWKWILAVLGIPVVCFSLLAVDSYSRAVSSIAAHEARLAKDIGDLRGRIKAVPLPAVDPLSPEELKQLLCPAESFLNDDEAAARIERGHTGQNERVYSRFQGVRLRIGQRAWPIDRILTATAVTLLTFREGGYSLHQAKTTYEQHLLQALIREIPGSPVNAADLRRLQRQLDELLASRVPVQEFVKGEHLLDRAEVLRVIPTQSDPTMMILRPPGWKELFSWKILVAKSMNQLDDTLRDHREPAADDQFHELDSNSSYAALGLRAGTVPSPPYTRSHLLMGERSVFSSERYCLALWQAARLATAIALLALEKGREPAELTELVPEYLSDIPACPYGNTRFVYRNGRLKTEGGRWNTLLRGK